MSSSEERAEQARRSMRRLTSLVSNGQHPDNGKEALWYLLGQCEDEMKKIVAIGEDKP